MKKSQLPGDGSCMRDSTGRVYLYLGFIAALLGKESSTCFLRTAVWSGIQAGPTQQAVPRPPGPLEHFV